MALKSIINKWEKVTSKLFELSGANKQTVDNRHEIEKILANPSIDNADVELAGKLERLHNFIEELGDKIEYKDDPDGKKHQTLLDFIRDSIAPFSEEISDKLETFCELYKFYDKEKEEEKLKAIKELYKEAMEKLIEEEAVIQNGKEKKIKAYKFAQAMIDKINREANAYKYKIAENFKNSIGQAIDSMASQASFNEQERPGVAIAMILSKSTIFKDTKKATMENAQKKFGGGVGRDLPAVSAKP